MAKKFQLKASVSTTSFNLDYGSVLNEQQLEVVTSSPGYALVIAGAGSGKTHTLTYRVAYLLEKGIAPSNILLLTFTNKAAREMSERVNSIVPIELSALWAGTFHSICSRILRKHAEEIGFNRSFTILDSDDQKSLLKKLIRQLELKNSNKRFPKAEVILSIYSLALNKQCSVEKILDEHYENYDDWREVILSLHNEYKIIKKESNSMDFDDLLALTLELFLQEKHICALYAKKFKYILVDEYQDTNLLQGKLIKILAGDNNSLMAVGDDAQSIYSWRGAEMENILSFSNDYPGAKVYIIETNYRSTPEILNLSNASIKANGKQYEKELRAHRENGMIPALVPLSDPNMQSSFICQKIQECRSEGIDLEDIAVLYRAHYHSMELQLELVRTDINFKVTSGVRFFEQAHLKDVTAFLKWINNPRDEISFARIISMLPGVGEKITEKIFNQWKQSNAYLEQGFNSLPSLFLFEIKGIPAKSKSYWEQLVYTIDELIDLSSTDGLASPKEQIYSVLEGFYREYAVTAFDNADQRLQDIGTLMEYASSYDELETLLSDLSLVSSVDDKKEEMEESITLSSVHQAKGLEWKVVFVIFLNERMFPSNRVIETGDSKQLEEERRLYYVSITRAKDELYLLYPMTNPKSYNDDYYLEPSRFLSECSSELTEEWEVAPW